MYDPEQLRTLLAVAGKLHGRDVGRAGILLGPMVAGFLVARWLAPRLDAGLLRPVLLWVSGAAATVVLLSALW